MTARNAEKGAMLDAITRAKQKLMLNRTVAGSRQVVGGGGSSGTVLASIQVPKSYTDRVVKEDTESNTNDSTSKLGKTTISSYIGARDNRTDFFNTWSRKIQLFLDDPKAQRLEFPPELSSNDRRELHGLADKYNLGHNSQGQGRERRLFLVKDALHHKARGVGAGGADGFQVQSADLDVIKNSTGGRKNRNEPREEIKYADENAEKRYNKFNNATNIDSRSVATGFTLEEVMSGNRNVGATAQGALGVAGSAWSQALAAPSSAPSGGVPSAPPSGGVDRVARVDKKFYNEKCTACGHSTPFEHDVSKWDCNGFCDKCDKETVWTLEEQLRNNNGQQRGKRDRDSTADEGGLSSGAVGPSSVDEMTVEEAVNLATMNEMSAGVILWIEKFGNLLINASLAQHLSFAVDFTDCTFFKAQSGLSFFKVRQTKKTPLDAGLEALFAGLGLAGSSPAVLSNHKVHVAMPATPNYGGETEAVVGLQLYASTDGARLTASVNARFPTPCITYATTIAGLE